jgi:excisionase family DNA binding protein
VGEDDIPGQSNNDPGQSKNRPSGYSVTVEDAARRLSVKEDTIRKRVQRGKIMSRRGAGGRMEVILTPEEYFGATADTSETALDVCCMD